VERHHWESSSCVWELPSEAELVAQRSSIVATYFGWPLASWANSGTHAPALFLSLFRVPSVPSTPALFHAVPFPVPVHVVLVLALVPDTDDKGNNQPPLFPHTHSKRLWFRPHLHIRSFHHFHRLDDCSMIVSSNFADILLRPSLSTSGSERSSNTADLPAHGNSTHFHSPLSCCDGDDGPHSLVRVLVDFESPPGLRRCSCSREKNRDLHVLA
jgi:hypothetical protein